MSLFIIEIYKLRLSLVPDVFPGLIKTLTKPVESSPLRLVQALGIVHTIPNTPSYKDKSIKFLLVYCY